MKASVILSLAIACMAAPMAPQGAYKDALDIINGQSSKFGDAALRKRHEGNEPDSFNVVFKDGVSIDQITEHLKLLDGLINKDSLNGIKTAFDLPSQKDGSGLMGYTGHFDKHILETLANHSDLVSVEEDKMQHLPIFEEVQSTQTVFQSSPAPYRGMINNFFKWWRDARKSQQEDNWGNPGDNWGGNPGDNWGGNPGDDWGNPGDDWGQPIDDQPSPGQFPPNNGGQGPNEPYPDHGEDSEQYPPPPTGGDPTLPTPSEPFPGNPSASRAPPSPPYPSNGSTAPGPGTFTEVPTKNWGLFRVSHKQNSQDQSQYAINKDTLNPTVAYIVDSGIRASHRMFEGRAVQGANFADNSPRDNNGHGTHVAGTIGGAGYGVSPSTKLIGVKVFAQKSAPNSVIMQGISWAIDDFVKNKSKYPRGVLNFSGGGDTSNALDALFKKAIENGMVAAVAAGNENQNACHVSPARVGANLDGMFTVAASSRDDSFAVWDLSRNAASNWGSCIDVIAPGTDILSASFQSDDGIASMSGTSMATPHVAGLAAQLMATSSELLSPAQVENKLINANNGVISGNLRDTPNKLAYNGSGK